MLSVREAEGSGEVFGEVVVLRDGLDERLVDGFLFRSLGFWESLLLLLLVLAEELTLASAGPWGLFPGEEGVVDLGVDLSKIR